MASSVTSPESIAACALTMYSTPGEKTASAADTGTFIAVSPKPSSVASKYAEYIMAPASIQSFSPISFTYMNGSALSTDTCHSTTRCDVASTPVTRLRYMGSFARGVPVDASGPSAAPERAATVIVGFPHTRVSDHWDHFHDEISSDV